MTSRIPVSTALVLSGWMICLSAGLAPTFTVKKFDIKGEGGTDYLTAERGTIRVFVTRSTHVMVVNSLTGLVLAGSYYTWNLWPW